MISLLILVVFLLVLGGGLWGWPLLAGVLGISGVKDKSSAIKQILQLMKTYEISLADIEAAAESLARNGSAAPVPGRGDVARTLFSYLGGIFILAGVGTYTGMFWESMGSAMRILITLGIGYVLLVVLVCALYEKKFPGLILPLALAATFMMTGGWFVLIDELFPYAGDWRLATLVVFGLMTLHQGGLFHRYRLTVFAFMALLFVYGFMQVGLDKAGVPLKFIAMILGASLFLVGTELEKTPYRQLAEPAVLIGLCWFNSGMFDLIAQFAASDWASLVVGVSAVSAAYGLHRADRYPRLISLGYLIGSALGYTGLFDLLQGTALELLFLAVTVALLYGSVALQSRALLLTTVIAMLGFIGYYSAEYFANSLGWPLTLVLMGLLFLGIGAIALKLKRRI